ncbi:MAG: hypothetical protein ACTSU5_06235 [Promethearchaeota archaeon]
MSRYLLDAFTRGVNFFEGLEDEGVLEYIVVGGTLTPIYAQPRQTQDIDFVIQIDLEGPSLAILRNGLERAGFKPFSTWEAAFLDVSTAFFTNFLDPGGLVKVDLTFVPVNLAPASVYQKLGPVEMANRERVSLYGVECWAQSKEDFIISKLVFGGVQDYNDALACYLRFRQELDLSRVEAVLSDLGVGKRQWKAIVDNKQVDEVFRDDF